MANSYLRHPDNYLSATRRLTLEERGAYGDLIELFITRDGDLPDNPQWMARDLACDVRVWNRIRKTLIETGHISIENGNLEPNGARSSLNLSLTKSESSRDAANRRWAKKSNKPLKENNTDDANAYAEADAIKSSHVIEPKGSNISIKSDFNEFWSHVPRKVGKGGAETAYAKARKLTDRETLLAGVMRHAAEVSNKDPTFIPHPTTWLNQKRWLDEPEVNNDNRNRNQQTPAAPSISAAVSRFVAAGKGLG